jgi:FlaG protein
MSDSRDIRIEPTPPVGGAVAVQPVRTERSVGAPGNQRPAPEPSSVAASTGGNLRAAYAQFVIDPDSHDVVVRIRDSATNQVIDELPSKEIQAMTAYLKNYAATMARRKAALKRGAGR